MTVNHLEGVVEPEWFSSVADAQSHASFTILQPRSLPTGTILTGVAYHLWPSDVVGGHFDFVMLFYLTSELKPIMVNEGYTGLPRIVASTPRDAHGTTMVRGKAAVWVDGLEGSERWERGMLSLGWEESTENSSGLPRVYTINVRASDFTVAELVSLAESVR